MKSTFYIINAEKEAAFLYKYNFISVLHLLNILVLSYSTVAASINALATVTFEDLVKQCLPNLSEKKSTWISKGLCR